MATTRYSPSNLRVTHSVLVHARGPSASRMTPMCGVRRRTVCELYRPRAAEPPLQRPAPRLPRFTCTDCRTERLIPFSCRGRAVWSERLAERAAHLVDHVRPVV